MPQPCVLEAVTLCSRGCNPCMRGCNHGSEAAARLSEAAAPCTRRCNPVYERLPCVGGRARAQRGLHPRSLHALRCRCRRARQPCRPAGDAVIIYVYTCLQAIIMYHLLCSAQCTPCCMTISMVHHEHADGSSRLDPAMPTCLIWHDEPARTLPCAPSNAPSSPQSSRSNAPCTV